jgi:hypothetical protein
MVDREIEDSRLGCVLITELEKEKKGKIALVIMMMVRE